MWDAKRPACADTDVIYTSLVHRLLKPSTQITSKLCFTGTLWWESSRNRRIPPPPPPIQYRASAKGNHYDDVIINAMTPKITSFTIVYSTVYSGADQIKQQSSASLAFAGEFPAQMASTAENASIRWRRHVFSCHGIIMVCEFWEQLIASGNLFHANYYALRFKPKILSLSQTIFSPPNNIIFSLVKWSLVFRT